MKTISYNNFYLIQNRGDFERNNTDGNVTRYYKRVLVQLPIDYVGLVKRPMFFLNEAVHSIQSIKRISLLLSVNENRIWKLRSILSHVQDIVRQIDFLGVLGIDEGKNSVAIHFVKLTYLVGNSVEILSVGKGA
jgi:hypothetical protein